MTRKILALVTALMLLCSAVALADVPAFEDIVFPDNLPAGIVFADETYDYSYDDLTEQYAVSIMTQNYGTPNVDNGYDPVVYWLNQHFNLDITYESVDDLTTTLSTRAAADDLPELFETSSREFAFALDDAGLLVDAKTIYPYMPLSCQYATAPMIAYSTNQTGNVAFVTGYGIQDGVWTNAVRTDWLEKFGMDFPTTWDEVKEYAYKCTFEDPDGNGVDDSYFMTNWGTISSWMATAGGYNGSYVDDEGYLSHPYFNGSRYTFLSYVKELLDMGVLAPDWYTMDWATQKIYYANNQIGALNYPVMTLLAEWTSAANRYDEEYCNVWGICEKYPINDNLYSAAGYPGYCWCFTTEGFGDTGKLMRLAHMIDTMRIGGENYEYCMQDGTTELYQFYADAHEGITVNENLTRGIVYTDDNMFYLWQIDATPDNLDDNQYLYGSDYFNGYNTGAWQHFGLAVSWQLTDPDPTKPNNEFFGAKYNELVAQTAGVARYANLGLLITLTGDAAEASAANGDWINACEIEFIQGTRELTEETYAEWAQEWLSKGGDAIVEQTAECLGCELPDIMK